MVLADTCDGLDYFEPACLKLKSDFKFTGFGQMQQGSGPIKIEIEIRPSYSWQIFHIRRPMYRDCDKLGNGQLLNLRVVIFVRAPLGITHTRARASSLAW